MADVSHQARTRAPPNPTAPRDVGAALSALSADDLLRLRAIARLRARALPGGVAWSDLLHEAGAARLGGLTPLAAGRAVAGFPGGG